MPPDEDSQTDPFQNWDAARLALVFARLNDQQLQILKWIASSETNSQIAARLGLAEKTVEKHITNLFRTMEVGNRIEAAVVYVLGWRDSQKTRSNLCL
ncbi:MAG: helix-turn-helix transcriptional regulator [Verrucomicrobiota bacterium]